VDAEERRMKITMGPDDRFPEGDVIDTDRLREYGGIINPRPKNPVVERMVAAKMLPSYLDPILADQPEGTRVVHSEICDVRGGIGWYAILETPE
jgi:hypothetical protein